MQKVPYMCVIGKQEEEAGTVNLRSYKDGERGSMNPADLKAEILDHIKNRVLDVNIKKLDLDSFVNEDAANEEQEY